MGNKKVRNVLHLSCFSLYPIKLIINGNTYKENKRIVDFSGNGFSMVATENEENTKYFNRYIKDIELLSVIDVLEDYSKDALLFMFVLAFSQFNFKDKNKKANSVFFNVFLILALIFSSVAFNTYSIDLEFKVLSDFANYGLS